MKIIIKTDSKTLVKAIKSSNDGKEKEKRKREGEYKNNNNNLSLNLKLFLILDAILCTS